MNKYLIVYSGTKDVQIFNINEANIATLPSEEGVATINQYEGHSSYWEPMQSGVPIVWGVRMATSAEEAISKTEVPIIMQRNMFAYQLADNTPLPPPIEEDIQQVFPSGPSEIPVEDWSPPKD